MAVQKDTWDVMRCQKMKLAAQKLSPINAKFYEDIQADYRTLLPIILSWTLNPYTYLDENGNECVVTTEQVLASLQATVPADVLSDVLLVGCTVATMSQTSASSFYGTFFENYKCNESAKWTAAKGDFLEKLSTLTDDQLSARLEDDTCLSQLTVAEWREVQVKLSAGVDKKEVWKEISPRLVNRVNAAYIRVRKALKIQVRQPDNKEYCSTLAEMIRLQVKSAYQKNLDHQEVSQELRNKVDTYRNANPEIFNLVLAFNDRLYSLGSGLSKVVLLRSIECVNNQVTSDNPTYKIAMAEIVKPEFSVLLTCKREDLIRAYNGVKVCSQLNRRKAYPRLPSFKNDYKVMFGLTSLAKFKMRINNDRLCVTFAGGEEEVFLNSYYFHDLKVECDKSKNQYNIKFRHKVKTKKKNVVSDEIVGCIKQIGLQKRDGCFYVSLMFTMSHDAKVFKLEKFFKTAAPDMSKYKDLPETIRVAAFDLNISNPVVGCIAEVTKDGLVGSLDALDYGKGNLVAGPDIVCPDTNLSDEIRVIKRLIFNVKDAIKEYKYSVNNGVPMDKKVLAFLEGIESPSPVPRCRIQTWIKKIRTTLAQLHSKVWSSGYVSISESLRILEAQDAMRSLISSYERIHLKSGQQMHAKPKFDKTRQNFREFISRKIASRIVGYAKGCDIIFIEDLAFEFNADNDNNSLVRLFSPGGLIKCITDAAYKAGIGVVLVDPMGTTKTDAVTGEIGCQDSKKTKNLYVERDGVLGCIDSDKNAALNVMIRGLGHSIVPYKFYVRGKKEEVIIDGEIQEKEIGKRLQRYYANQFGIAKPVFSFDERTGTVVACKKLVKEDNPVVSMYVYAHGTKLCTGKAHIAKEKALAARVAAGEPVVPFGFDPCPISGYKGFQMQQFVEKV